MGQLGACGKGRGGAVGMAIYFNQNEVTLTEDHKQVNVIKKI